DNGLRMPSTWCASRMQGGAVRTAYPAGSSEPPDRILGPAGRQGQFTMGDKPADILPDERGRSYTCDSGPFRLKWAIWDESSPTSTQEALSPPPKSGSVRSSPARRRCRFAGQEPRDVRDAARVGPPPGQSHALARVVPASGAAAGSGPVSVEARA